MKLETLSHRELITLRDRIAPALAKARSLEADGLRERITSMITQAGLSVIDVMGRPPRTHKAYKGYHVAKFANPDNPTQTWTGRGRPPNWLIAKCKLGSTRDQFAV